MTVEADARETISVAEVACVFCLRSAGDVTLLSVGPPFRGDLLWPPGGPPSSGQLSIQEVFGDAAVWHAMDVAQPTESVLSEQCEHEVIHRWRPGPEGAQLGQRQAEQSTERILHDPLY